MPRDLQARRNELVRLIQNQRERVSTIAEQWRIPLQFVDRGIGTARYLVRHPFLMLAAASVLRVFVPSRVGKYFNRGWLGIQVMRKLKVF